MPLSSKISHINHKPSSKLLFILIYNFLSLYQTTSTSLASFQNILFGYQHHFPKCHQPFINFLKKTFPTIKSPNFFILPIIPQQAST